jgi:hypothetical protein
LVLSGLLISMVPFALGSVPQCRFLQNATKCDYKSNRHRKHHTSFEQVFYPSALAAKQQILKYHLMKFHPAKYAAHKVLFQTSERWCAPWGRKFRQQSRR